MQVWVYSNLTHIQVYSFFEGAVYAYFSFFPFDHLGRLAFVFLIHLVDDAALLSTLSLSLTSNRLEIWMSLQAFFKSNQLFPNECTQIFSSVCAMYIGPIVSKITHLITRANIKGWLQWFFCWMWKLISALNRWMSNASLIYNCPVDSVYIISSGVIEKIKLQRLTGLWHHTKKIYQQHMAKSLSSASSTSHTHML